MNIKSTFSQRYLSTITLIAIYLIMVIIHIFYDSFILTDQLVLIVTMFPFIIIGFILDFLFRRNQTKDKTIRIFAQLLPAGIFGMQAISTVLSYAGEDSVSLFNYLIWIFLSLPFFIVSYNKEQHKSKMLYSIIGAGLFAAVYLFLTTQTDQMEEGSGAVIYFISYFLMIYAASGIQKLPLLGTALGILNAVALLWLRYAPTAETVKSRGWDYEIFSSIEFLLVGTFLVSVLIRLWETFQKKEMKTEKA